MALLVCNSESRCHYGVERRQTVKPKMSASQTEAPEYGDRIHAEYHDRRGAIKGLKGTLVNRFRITCCHTVRLDVGDHYRVRADTGMSANLDRSQDFRAGADVDVSPDLGHALAIPTAKRDLMEDQAVHANPGVGVDDYSIGVRNQKPSANLAIQGNVGPRHDAPEAVTQDRQSAAYPAKEAAAHLPILIAPDRKE